MNKEEMAEKVYGRFFEVACNAGKIGQDKITELAKKASLAHIDMLVNFIPSMEEEYNFWAGVRQIIENK